MKRILPTSAVILLLTCMAGAQVKSDREQQGLRGPVRSVLDEKARITVKDGTAVEGERRPTQLLQFDAEGNLAEASYYKEDGKLSSTHKYLYENGRLVGVETYGVGGKLVSRMVRSYDAAGRVRADAVSNDSGEIKARTVYVNSPADKSSEVSWYDAGGKLLRRRTRTNDGREIKTEEVQYNAADGSVARKSTWSRNADGSVRDYADYRAGGSLEHNSEYVGELPHSTTYNEDGTVRRRNYYTPGESDAHGNWIKRTLWAVEGDKVEAVVVYYRTITYH